MVKTTKKACKTKQKTQQPKPKKDIKKQEPKEVISAQEGHSRTAAQKKYRDKQADWIRLGKEK